MTATEIPDEVATVVRDLVGLLRDGEPTLIGVDLDGTLADIVEHARAARLVPGALAALERLDACRGVEVVVLTGRAHDDAVSTFGLPSTLKVVGSHGHEHHDPAVRATLRAPVTHPLGAETQALDDLEAQAGTIATTAAGAWVERKPHSVVLHVRMVEPGERAGLLEAYRQVAAARGWEILEGSAVLEAGVAPLDKGAAIEELRSELGVAAVCFIGDDVTDERVFRRLREDDLGIKVGSGATLARRRLGNPGEVVDLLARVGAELPTSSH